jgi:hypothetical protein
VSFVAVSVVVASAPAAAASHPRGWAVAGAEGSSTSSVFNSASAVAAPRPALLAGAGGCSRSSIRTASSTAFDIIAADH